MQHILIIYEKIIIGINCMFWFLHKTYIDLHKPHMSRIADYVKITRNVIILCHDYSRNVIVNISDGTNTGTR